MSHHKQSTWHLFPQVVTLGQRSCLLVIVDRMQTNQARMSFYSCRWAICWTWPLNPFSPLLDLPLSDTNMIQGVALSLGMRFRVYIWECLHLCEPFQQKGSHIPVRPRRKGIRFIAILQHFGRPSEDYVNHQVHLVQTWVDRILYAAEKPEEGKKGEG